MLERRSTSGQTSFEVLRGAQVGNCKWYALQTVPNHEKKVALQLGLDGLDVFVPIFSRESRWTDRKKVIEQPIFPGYAFLFSADILGHRKFLHRHRSIIRLLTHGTAPAEIADGEMESVRHITSAKAEASPIPFLNIGQRIRIANGSLRGLEGILVRATGANKLVISVSLIQRSVSICIEGYEIEPL